LSSHHGTGFQRMCTAIWRTYNSIHTWGTPTRWLASSAFLKGCLIDILMLHGRNIHEHDVNIDQALADSSSKLLASLVKMHVVAQLLVPCCSPPTLSLPCSEALPHPFIFGLDTEKPNVLSTAVWRRQRAHTCMRWTRQPAASPLLAHSLKLLQSFMRAA